jgi:ribose 5-phosphate isomerase B
MTKIILGADHGGFTVKEAIKAYLLGREEFTVEDKGAYSLETGDDYPAISAKVARAVIAMPDSLGILLCRSGQGVCIAANKIVGIRAILAWRPEVAVSGKRDDLANVLCLPADFVSPEAAATIIDAWLGTEAGTDERYVRRAKEVAALEKGS